MSKPNVSIREALRDEVLKQGLQDHRAEEERKSLQALSEALVETTSLDRAHVTGVIANLQKEAEARPVVILPALRWVSPQKLRIAAYLILGLTGYSAYKSAQVENLQQDQFYQQSLNSTVEFQIGVGNTRALLTDAVQAHYKRFDRFPLQIDELDSGVATTRYLDSSALFTEYKMTGDGGIVFRLAETYGYNRWLELKPELVEHPSWVKIEFACRSNAQARLLQNNGDNWCEYSAGKTQIAQFD